jgi:hypothetical protein
MRHGILYEDASLEVQNKVRWRRLAQQPQGDGLSSEDGHDIDDHLCSRAVHHCIAIDVSTVIPGWQRYQLSFHACRERLHPSLPSRREVAVAIEFLL